MKIIKFLTMILILISLPNALKALTIFSSDVNKIEIIGNLNFAYFDSLKSKQTYSYIKNNNYNSNLGISFINESLDLVSTKVTFDVRINNTHYYPEKENKEVYNIAEINNFYFELITKDNSYTKIGFFDSMVTKNTVGATNKAYVYWLDAGYSFMNQDSNYGNKKGEDFLTIKSSGIGHYNAFSNYIAVLEVYFPKNSLESRAPIETDALSQGYSFGGSLNYQGDVFGYSIGYKKVRTKIKNDSINNNLSQSMLRSDNLLASLSLSGKNIYFALSGGYYKNQKLAGIRHTGASAYLSYQLTKIIPYLGYQFLYADNIDSSIKDGKDIYNLANRRNYSFEQSVAVLGLAFKVHDGFYMGIEHNNDIRSKSHTESSILNNVNQDITSIYLRYSL